MRVLSVNGELDECISLAKELLNTCPQAPYSVGHHCEYEMNILIWTESAGMIIGRGGQNLKEIRGKGNGKIKVYQDCLPNSNERVVAIGGETEYDVLNALRRILNRVKDSQRNHVVYYDPNNRTSDIMGTGITGSGPGSGTVPVVRVVAIGGDTEYDVLNALRTVLNVVNDIPRTHAVCYDPNTMPSENMGAGIIGSGPVPLMEQGYSTLAHGHTGGMGGSIGGGMGGVMGGGNLGNENEPFQQVFTVTTLTVPNEMCGAIIGVGGIRIKEIRNTSGAKIDFTDLEKGSTSITDRVIAISGTQYQVNVAEQLMAQCWRNRAI